MDDTVLFASYEMRPYYEHVRNGNVTEVKGLLSFFVDFITSATKRSFRIVPAKGDGVGYELTPGNWTGLIGMLARKEVDVLAGIGIIVPEISPYVDFSTSFGDLSYSILSGPPSSSSSGSVPGQQSVSFVSTVGSTLSLYLAAVWTLLSVLYYCFNIWEDKVHGRVRQENCSSLVEVLLAFYGLLFQKGTSRPPSSTPCRLLLSAWLLFVVFTMVRMSGTFSSKLIIQDQPQYIESFEDILRNPNLKPYITKGLTVDTYISHSPLVSHKQLWQQMERLDTIRDPAEFFHPLSDRILQEVSEGRAVAVAAVRGVLIAMLNDHCSRRKPRPFHIARDPFLTSPLAIVHRKGLDPDLIETLNRASSVYGGMGFQKKLWDTWSQSARPCLQFSQPEVKPLWVTGFADFRHVLEVFRFGLLVSLLVLILEIICGLIAVCFACKEICYIHVII